MLNIPEEVKNLFRQGNITKNFRIHFPNGERADLTNDDLVSESVQFTESLCSQESLKFGLCEASVLEFETIDVENITGCVIEASIEIAVSGTEAEALDGTVTWEDGRKAYPVPLGRFTVDSAKRQKNLHRRNVTAYDALYSGNLDKDLSDLGITRPNEYGYITIGAKPGMNYSGFFHFNINHYLRMYAVNSKMSGTAQEFGKPAGSFTEKEGSAEKTVAIRDSTVGVGATLYVKEWVYTPQTDVVTNFGLNSALKLEAFDSKVRSAIRETCQKHGIAFDDLTKMPNPVVVRLMRTMPDSAEPPEVEAQGNATAQADTAVPDLELVAPYITPGLMIEWSDFSGAELLTMKVPLRLEIYSTGEEGGIAQITVLESVTFDECPAVEMYNYAKDSILNFTMKEDVKITSYRSLLTGALELMGRFGRIDRTTCRLEYVSPGTEPVTIEGDMYADVWTEEYTTKAYGAINAKYTDMDGKTQILLYQFGEGENTYYMHDNAILNAVMLTGEQVQTILAGLAEQIQGVAMTPFELTGQGMPYLEAGDMLQIETEAGMVTSYLLRREMQGIIGLEDSMENSIEELAKVDVDTTQVIVAMATSGGGTTTEWATDEDILGLFG